MEHEQSLPHARSVACATCLMKLALCSTPLAYLSMPAMAMDRPQVTTKPCRMTVAQGNVLSSYSCTYASFYTLQAQEHVESNVALAAQPRLSKSMWSLVSEQIEQALKSHEQRTKSVGVT